MSRTNHYRICDDCGLYIRCWRHDGPYSRTHYNHKPIRVIEGRRVFVRKPRFPEYSPKQWHTPPSRGWWAKQKAKARAIQKREFLKSIDPYITPMKKLINLWDWY